MIQLQTGLNVAAFDIYSSLTIPRNSLLIMGEILRIMPVGVFRGEENEIHLLPVIVVKGNCNRNLVSEKGVARVSISQRY